MTKILEFLFPGWGVDYDLPSLGEILGTALAVPGMIIFLRVLGTLLGP